MNNHLPRNQLIGKSASEDCSNLPSNMVEIKSTKQAGRADTCDDQTHLAVRSHELHVIATDDVHAIDVYHLIIQDRVNRKKLIGL